jgi:hypothetical protein
MLIAVNSFERLEELVLTEWIEDLALSPLVASTLLIVLRTTATGL